MGFGPAFSFNACVNSWSLETIWGAFVSTVLASFSENSGRRCDISASAIMTVRTLLMVLLISREFFLQLNDFFVGDVVRTVTHDWGNLP